MTIHIVVGSASAQHIEAALSSASLSDRVICIEDDFSYGPLRKPTVPFSLLRHQYWQELSPTRILDPFHDLERVLELLNLVNEDNDLKVIFWMNNNAPDILTYYFLLHYLKPLLGHLYVININGLPFLNDDLQLFYPFHFTEINQRGIIKALKLARAVTLSELEADGDEWKAFQQEQTNEVRILKSGKAVISSDYDFIDQQIKDIVLSYPHKKWSKLLLQLKPSHSSLEAMVYTSRMQILISQNIIHTDNGNLSLNS